MENRKICPYCGEEIAESAKKCRFCGEWLGNEEAVLVPETVETGDVAYTDPQDSLEVRDYNGMGQVPATVVVDGVPQPVNPQMAVRNPSGQPYQQPVINIQLAQNTNVSQEVSQTTVVESGDKSSGSSSGFLWVELLAVGGAVWGAVGHWWAGVVTWILLAIATQIPVLGSIICVVLGLGVGLVAGVIAAAFSAPTWVCWLIGIVVGIGAIGINMEDKDHIDD